MKNLVLVIVIILVIMLIIFLCNNSKKKNIEPTFKVAKSIITEKKVHSPMGQWSKECSRNLILSTMPNNVKTFFNKVLDTFDGYHLYLGMKNYLLTAPSPDKQFQWELYILPELGKLDVNLSTWYDQYQKIFVNNYKIEEAHPPNDIQYERIISISVDIDSETPKTQKTDKLNFYYHKILDFPSYYMDEITFRSHDYVQPNINILRGKSLLGIGRGLSQEQMQSYMNFLGIGEPDVSNLTNYVKNLKFPHATYSITEKSIEYGLYITCVGYDTFLQFLKDNKYSVNTISYVQENRDKIENQFAIEIALYFKKGDPTMKVNRSAFYVTLNK